ncbi:MULTISPECIES: serine hydrolase domain-containing protein [Pontibacillus]|uniref:Serine hydrolase domain-containing protein n=1 Tax=Pontibacillus chungwhensis TaxID=265426 RepID=A0ABY8UVA5_9BACI|nr:MULTISPECIES: beta-lactamase family protein [Pontibacillus]MCD5323310.1 beta-lactamase family protein [Pontibacillus sp. HN14]WIF96691.1 serine hydrolase domain-containing protein [Pontibacillus chungwhensis]
MQLNHTYTNAFEDVHTHVKESANKLGASGGALYMIQNDKVITESYFGYQSEDPNARKVQGGTQFHIASVRKAYIGFAAAYAIYHGYFSINDPIWHYVEDSHLSPYEGVTIRHLLTHTHGLQIVDGELVRNFHPGESWAYRGPSIDLLTSIIHKTTGQSVAEIVKEQVFDPVGFQSTEWIKMSQPHSKIASTIRDTNNVYWTETDVVDGSGMNMYVSARELALWGYLHLKEGKWGDRQLVPREIIQLATSIQTPDPSLPIHKNGCLWFVKDTNYSFNQLGDGVPKGSYQLLGYTNVALLVIPDEDLVAVRMFNRYGSSEGFDYLEDIRSFGDMVYQCAAKTSAT